MEKEKVALIREQETLMVPLYSRALETRKASPIIEDRKALEIVDSIDYDFSKLEIPKQTHVTICMRAKYFDDFTRTFLNENPRSLFIHLGCGLDSRFERIDNGSVEWYDLDYAEVMKLRKKFYSEKTRYNMIESSAINISWLDKVDNSDNKPVVILAEGLLMYLPEEEIKKLFQALQSKFGHCLIIFDCYSLLTASNINRHPSFQKTGAVVYWGIDEAEEIEEWGENIHLLDEWYFSKSSEIDKLDFFYRLLFKMAGASKIAQKAHRIITLELG
ncbi:MAG: class I SAM-dependent methyltransferase [Bacillota bacterium]|nr:class I SAM-dependent methyltransferase [Bacillota bacterium]